jgi:hypothetical protein
MACSVVIAEEQALLSRDTGRPKQIIRGDEEC